MKSMTRTILACITVFLLVGATGGPVVDPFLAMPASPLVLATLADPGVFLANALAFSRRAGLAAPEEAFGDILDALGGGGDDIPPGVAALLGMLDPHRRLVAGLYAPPEGTGSPGILVCVPVTDQATAAARLEAASAEGSAPSSAVWLPGYLIVGLGMDAPQAEPSETLAPESLSGLRGCPATGIAVWVDIRRVGDIIPAVIGSIPEPEMSYPEETDYGTEYEGDWDEGSSVSEADATSDDEEAEGDTDAQAEGAEEDAGAETTTESTDAGQPPTADTEPAAEETPTASDAPAENPDEPEYELVDDEVAEPDVTYAPTLTASIMGAFTALLEGVQSMDARLVVDGRNIWVSGSLTADPASPLGLMATAAGAGTATWDYLPYCDAEALLSFASSARPDWSVEYLEDMFGTLFPELSDDLPGLLEAGAAAVGGNAAGSLYLDPSEEFMQAVRNGSLEVLSPQALARGIGMSATAAFEVRDRQAFRDALAGSMAMLNGPEMGGLLASIEPASDMADESGMEPGIGIMAVRSVGSRNGMPWDRYLLSACVTEGDSVDVATVKTWDALLGAVASPTIAYADDRAFVTLGTASATTGDATRPAKALQSDKAFRTLRAGMPRDARALWYLSTKRFLRLVLRVQSPGSVMPFALNEAAGLLGWTSASAGRLGFGMATGAEDIRALVYLTGRDSASVEATY